MTHLRREQDSRREHDGWARAWLLILGVALTGAAFCLSLN